MDKNLLQSRLTERIDTTFRLEDPPSDPMEFRLRQFHINGSKVTLFTDGKPLDFHTYDECNSFINLLKEIDSVPETSRVKEREESLAPVSRPSALIEKVYEYKVGSNVLNELKDITLDNIKKLQAEGGAEFIPQAQEINKQVHTVIDLAKTEIELVKTIKEL